MRIRNLLATLTLTVGITMAALPMTSYGQTQISDNTVSAQVQKHDAVINISFQSSTSLSLPVSLTNPSQSQSGFTFNIEKFLFMGAIVTMMALAIYLFL
jgi:hypothetical protein